MTIRVHGVEPFETFGIGDGAELGDIWRTVGGKFNAQRVGAAAADQRSSEQVRPLRDSASDQDAAGAGAFTRQALRAGVFVFDQVLSAGDEIVDGVLFGQLVAGAVPLLAVFAATANMRERDDAATFQPRQPDRIKKSVIGNS